MTDVLAEQQAAEWMRVSIDQLRTWRKDDAGPNFTPLRNGSATYLLRDLKIHCRNQMALRKVNSEA